MGLVGPTRETHRVQAILRGLRHSGFSSTPRRSMTEMSAAVGTGPVQSVTRTFQGKTILHRFQVGTAPGFGHIMWTLEPLCDQAVRRAASHWFAVMF
ncbi:MAG: hypothetical protein GDA36_09890 [Rhodobacteraceae bacterium]|nr:hypothetical protein [Paracoccaceae bacterium]